MRHIKILDTTLRDGEQSPGCSMDTQEKLDIARALIRLKVDIIEAGFAAASPGDQEAISLIAKLCKDNIVTSLCRAVTGDIDLAYNCLKAAVAPRIHIVLATSPLHMEYKLRATPDRVIEMTRESVAYAKRLTRDVEFSAEDATRSDPAFLARVFETAIGAGATVVSVPDTVGYATPDTMEGLMAYLLNHVKGIEKADLSVHCHDDLGMAVANALAAVKAGASQVECTINGIGERAGMAALEEVVMALKARGDVYGAKTGIETRQLYRASRLLQNIIGVPVAPNKAVVGDNAFSHEAGIHQHGVMQNRETYELLKPEDIGIPKSGMVLGKHSGRHAFEARLLELGYPLTGEELDDAFERFKLLADKKKEILDRDLEALMQKSFTEQPGRYALDNFVINTGNTISSIARVTLTSEGTPLESMSVGHGPLDAGFKAIDAALGMDFQLDDFSLHSVTEGEDALGEAVVKLSFNGISAVGRGMSTDIIEASLRAYVSGANKLVQQLS